VPYYQFPWRFLGLAIFCFSFISGSLIKFFPKYKYILTICLILVTIVINIQFFKEDIWFPNLTDQQKLSPSEIYRQSGAGLKDYWPYGTLEFPTTMATEPFIQYGTARIIKFQKSSNSITGEVTVNSDSANIILPVSNFPTWKLLINNLPANYSIDLKYGQIILQLPAGNNTFKLLFTNTPVRSIANLLSIFGICIYIIKVTREKHL
jgi:hypothetical protein